VEYIIENIFRRFFQCWRSWRWWWWLSRFVEILLVFLLVIICRSLRHFFLFLSLSLPIFLLLIRPFKVETILFWKHKEENIKIPSTKMKWKSLYKIVNYCLKHNVDIWQIPSSFNFCFELHLHCYCTLHIHSWSQHIFSTDRSMIDIPKILRQFNAKGARSRQ
jgi:hypothetical protein